LRQLLGTFPNRFWIRKMTYEQILGEDLLDLVIHKVRAFGFH
jgi:hypothetical protein